MPLERAFHLVRDLFWTPWSVRAVARRDEVAWFAQNVQRRHLLQSTCNAGRQQRPSFTSTCSIQAGLQRVCPRWPWSS